MLLKRYPYGLSLLMFFALQVTVLGQYKFEGSLRSTEDYTNQTPASTATVTVYTSGGLTSGTTLATGLTKCTDGTAQPNPINATDGGFCFRGNATTYDVKISSDSQKVRRVISEENIQTPGVYKLTDFGAVVGDSSSDHTYIIKSAMAYIGMRYEIGGRLIVPNGIYKVLAGNATLPIVLPPGLTFEGQNGKGNFGSSRIQLEADNKALFRIGNNSNKITVRDLSLVVPLVSCTTTACNIRPGNKAIYAAGDGLSTLGFVATNINIQGFEEGISVEGLDASKDWQFGQAAIENSNLSCLYPVRLNAQNAELKISNSTLLTGRQSAGTSYYGEEASVRIDKAGALTMTKVYGGTVLRDVGNKPLAFILVKGRHSTIKLTDCQSENTEHNFLYDYNPPADDVKFPIIFEGVGFGDLVVFKGNVIFTSVGSGYGSNSVQFWGTAKGGNSTTSEIYSYGDQFYPITNKLYVCPAASGVTSTNYPPERPNGDFRRLTDGEIEPASGDLERNVCRRDFYLYNSSPSETNRVVVRTAQRKYSTGDSDSLTNTNFQTSLQITAPPVFDSFLTDRPGKDRFKTWGYKIERNSTDAVGALDFIGNQKPPNFLNGNFSYFRFNGGIYPTEDNQYELGNTSKRWSLIRGVTIVSGDTILSDKVTGKELYKIHEDEDFIYFTDIRTGKELMKIGRNGNLYLTGRIIQNSKSVVAKRKTVRKQKAKGANK